MSATTPDEAPRIASAPDTVLRADGVHHDYRGTPVLEDISLELRPGQALALLGANGAGKTTLLEVCAGARSPSRGTITRASDTRIGWVPPSASYWGKLSARENLRAFCRLEGIADPKGRTEELLAATGLSEAGDRRADRLSTGMGQRLNLGVALAGSPEVLLLDEPTATLSPDQRVRFWDLIADLRAGSGLAVIFSTQSVPEAAQHADRLLVLAGGTVAFAGGIAELAGPDAGADVNGAAEEAFIRMASP